MRVSVVMDDDDEHSWSSKSYLFFYFSLKVFQQQSVVWKRVFLTCYYFESNQTIFFTVRMFSSQFDLVRRQFWHEIFASRVYGNDLYMQRAIVLYIVCVCVCVSTLIRLLGITFWKMLNFDESVKRFQQKPKLCVQNDYLIGGYLLHHPWRPYTYT